MLTRLARSLDRALALLLAALLAAIVLAVTWQVVSRYVLDDASGWTEELARFLLIWIGLLGGALAYQRRLHLGIDLWNFVPDTKMVSGTETVKKSNNPMTDTINACVLVFAVVVLVVGGGALVVLTIELEQYSPALRLPMAVVYLALPASGLIMAISALSALAEREP